MPTWGSPEGFPDRVERADTSAVSGYGFPKDKEEHGCCDEGYQGSEGCNCVPP